MLSSLTETAKTYFEHHTSTPVCTMVSYAPMIRHDCLLSTDEKLVASFNRVISKKLNIHDTMTRYYSNFGACYQKCGKNRGLPFFNFRPWWFCNKNNQKHIYPASALHTNKLKLNTFFIAIVSNSIFCIIIRIIQRHPHKGKLTLQECDQPTGRIKLR